MPRSSATAVSSGATRGGYTPFTVELSDLLTYGEENTLLVRVDSTERTDFPPCGNVVDYLTYGGIYREVSLEVTEPRLRPHAAHQPPEKRLRGKRTD